MPSNDNIQSAFDTFEMSLNDISPLTPRTSQRPAEKRRRRTIAAATPAVTPTAEEPVEIESHAEGIEVMDTDEQFEQPAAPRATSTAGSAIKSATRQRQTRKAATKSGSGSIVNVVTDKRFAMFVGVVLLMFAAYALLSAISYIFTGSNDQSLVSNNTFDEISARAPEVNNAGGPVGAILSDFMLSRWLGIGSFIVIAYAIILAVSLLRLRPCHFWSLTFKSFVSAIAVSIISGALCMLAPRTWYWGGEHGYSVNDFMLTNTGIWGDLALNIIMLSALVLIFFDTLKKVFSFLAEQYNNYREELRERARQREEEEEAEYGEDEPEAAESAVKPSEPATQPEPETNRPATAAEAADEPEEDTKSVVKAAASLLSGRTVVAEPVEEVTAEAETAPAAAQDAAAQPEDGQAKEPEVEVEVGTIETADKIQTSVYDPTAELSRYKLPTIDLLNDRQNNSISVDQEEIEANKQRITRTLNSYGIEISSIRATVGPTITLYEIVPAEGVRISKIKNLGNDMALSLAALGIRIIAPIPGKGTIGMEVPNRDKQVVSIRSILSSQAYQESKAALPMAMGTTISNEVYVADLAKMPHLLVAGATGMGKSVGLNTIIASLLYKKHPAELKFVLVDPKMVEFSLYSTIERHFLAKLSDEEEAIITDPSKVMDTLNSLCVEMDNRYSLLKKAGVRDIKDYNAKFIQRRLNPNNGHRFLPYIVVIVDEFADLILTAGKEVETPISRLAAKARAIGIHVILATQRPSVNVITGVIKANFPGRMAFRVNQMNDSRTILDRPGADQLIGRGDMIISKDGIMERVQCALIETEEVERICEFISRQLGYDTAYELPEYVPPTEPGSAGGGGGGERDTLFAEAGRYIIESGIGSTTAIQRHFNVGFPRAGKIMDQLEMAGVVGPTQGGKPRRVLMDSMAFEDLLLTMS